jgi:hypothetical protein
MKQKLIDALLLISKECENHLVCYDCPFNQKPNSLDTECIFESISPCDFSFFAEKKKDEMEQEEQDGNAEMVESGCKPNTKTKVHLGNQTSKSEEMSYSDFSDKMVNMGMEDHIDFIYSGYVNEEIEGDWIIDLID